MHTLSYIHPEKFTRETVLCGGFLRLSLKIWNFIQLNILIFPISSSFVPWKSQFSFCFYEFEYARFFINIELQKKTHNTPKCITIIAHCFEDVGDLHNSRATWTQVQQLLKEINSVQGERCLIQSWYWINLNYVSPMCLLEKQIKNLKV